VGKVCRHGYRYGPLALHGPDAGHRRPRPSDRDDLVRLRGRWRQFAHLLPPDDDCAKPMHTDAGHRLGGLGNLRIDGVPGHGGTSSIATHYVGNWAPLTGTALTIQPATGIFNPILDGTGSHGAVLTLNDVSLTATALTIENGDNTSAGPAGGPSLGGRSTPMAGRSPFRGHF